MKPKVGNLGFNLPDFPRYSSFNDLKTGLSNHTEVDNHNASYNSSRGRMSRASEQGKKLHDQPACNTFAANNPPGRSVATFQSNITAPRIT